MLGKAPILSLFTKSCSWFFCEAVIWGTCCFKGQVKTLGTRRGAQSLWPYMNTEYLPIETQRKYLPNDLSPQEKSDSSGSHSGHHSLCPPEGLAQSQDCGSCSASGKARAGRGLRASQFRGDTARKGTLSKSKGHNPFLFTHGKSIQCLSLPPEN